MIIIINVLKIPIAMAYITTLLMLCVVPSVFAQNSQNRIQYEIYEQTPAKSYVGDIPQDAGLKDRYTEELQNIHYKMLSDSVYFEVDETSGILRTADILDREVVCPMKVDCTVDVEVAVQPHRYFEVLKVTVTVKDVNDKFPTFVPATLTRAVAENTPPGASIAIASAEDLDSPRYGVQQYELLQGAPTFELKIEGSILDRTEELHLVLKQTLDREVKEFYRVIIVVKDGGNPPNEGTLTIDVTVEDINDNFPEFEQDSYEVEVEENLVVNSTIVQVRATDKDAANNGKIVYGFNTKTSRAYGDIFAIHGVTGELTLRKELDYEETKTYTLTVTAQDSNPQSPMQSSTRVVIKVLDVNDHAPIITVNYLADTETDHVEILEDQPQETFVAYIEVEDPDSGLGGQFYCDLENDDIFEVRQLYPTEFKIVTVGLLDREYMAQYDLVFKCADLALSPKTSSVHIPVTVLDVNDNPPHFIRKLYTVGIKENNPRGLFLTQVKAVDLDAGPNAQIQYQAVGNAINFLQVDPNTGNVSAKVTFDYEQARELEFVILATDMGKPPKNATATLKLILTDVDDQIPEFTRVVYNFNVYENKPRNTEVGQVTAVDLDSSSYNSFSYYMDPSSQDIEDFVVDPVTGIIFTNRVLDRENRSQYSIVVRALSNHDATQSSNTRVNIHINDSNDNSPVILFPTKRNNTVYVASTAKVGQTVAMVTAIDADIGINEELSYTFVDSLGKTYFYLDEKTGVISVMANLRGVSEETFHMIILVKDKGHPQHTVETSMDIVVKHEEEEAMSSQNVIIVASVVTISGLLTIALVVAIVITRKQDQKKKKMRYLHKMNTDHNNLVVTDGKGQVGTLDMGHPGVKVDISFSNDITLEEDENNRITYPVQAAENGGKSPNLKVSLHCSIL